MFTPLLVAGIVFLAALVRSTFGFGGAIVNMALLTLVIGIQTATPVAALIGLFISIVIVGQSWREIDVGSAWRLILGAALGIPLGTLALTTAPEAVIVGLLGLLLILFGLYSLILPTLPHLVSRQWAYLFGFFGGCLGGAYNINGPPVVLYGTLRRWPPPSFRSTLQGFFLPTFFLVAVSHGLGGLWTREALGLFGLSILPALGGIVAGRWLNLWMDATQFSRYVFFLILLLGVVLTVRAFS